MSLLVGMDLSGNRIHISKYDKEKNGIVKCCVCCADIRPRRGRINAHHYAHKIGECIIKREHDCKTPWHMLWQNIAKADYLERIICRNDVKHIADVVNTDNVVIEVQHSSLSCDDIDSRELFHDPNHDNKMIWILDGRPIVKSDDLLQERITVVFSTINDYYVLKVTPRCWGSMTAKKYIDSGYCMYEVIKYCNNNVYICKKIRYGKFCKEFYHNILRKDIKTTVKKLKKYFNNLYEDDKSYNLTNSPIYSLEVRCDLKNGECVQCSYDEQNECFFGKTYNIRYALYKCGFLFDKYSKKWLWDEYRV